MLPYAGIYHISLVLPTVLFPGACITALHHDNYVEVTGPIKSSKAIRKNATSRALYLIWRTTYSHGKMKEQLIWEKGTTVNIGKEQQLIWGKGTANMKKKEEQLTL